MQPALSYISGKWVSGLTESRVIMAIAASLVLPIPFLTTLNKLPAAVCATGTQTRESLKHAKVVYADSTAKPLQKSQIVYMETPPAQSNSNSNADPLAPHRYAAKCAELERTFLDMAIKDDSEAPDSPWIPLVSISKPYPITVQGHVSKPFRFRVTFYAPTAPATAFDLLANVLLRPKWDELTEATAVIERLGQGDSIHYLKMKAIWPTASRDSVLLSHITSVQHPGKGDSPQRAYLNVSQSIIDNRMPEKDAQGIVRMEAGIAGQLVTEASLEDRTRLRLEEGSWCRVVQIADGDLKGWIPKSVIKFVATQALPRSLTKVCKQLATLPPSLDSKLIGELGQNPDPSFALAVLPPPPAMSSSAMAPSPISPTAENQLLARAAGKGSRAQWMVWLRIIMRYAAPSIIAAITSLIFNLIMHRRLKK
ncbi:hypothetical protein LPJ66_002956 [Kickxella alabastrina]|uniref:Uncharacterized protein n=1 Tax=Kickxella alabastrina TaxID=61397 RepID=A0ACC1IL71_9FUNG|nr:hypothetical protein LPJ66_002956 [Kickxella alabastrina]